MGSLPGGLDQLVEADADLTELTDKVTVATNAQKKLRHIVLILKLLAISLSFGENFQLPSHNSYDVHEPRWRIVHPQ